MTPAEAFLATEQAVDRTACERYLKSRGVDDNDAAAVQAAKLAYQRQPLLHDPEVISLSRAAIFGAHGPVVDESTKLVATVWYGGATDVQRGVEFASSIANYKTHVLDARAREVAPKRQGWVACPISTKPPLPQAPGRSRKNSETLAVHALNLDCDGNGTWDQILAALAELGLGYLAYQSGGWTPAVPKWHLLLPLARPFEINYSPERCVQWKAAYSTARVALGSLAGLLGCGFDPTVEAPSIPVFITERRDAADPPRQVVWRPGHSLDLDALCAALPKRPEEDRRYCERAAYNAAPLPDGEVSEIIKKLCVPMGAIYSGRRELYLALSGALLDRCVAPDDVYSIIEEVSRRCPGDPLYTQREVEDKHREHLHGADTTIAKYEAGELYTRIGELHGRWPSVAAAVDLALPANMDETLKKMDERDRMARSAPATASSPPEADWHHGDSEQISLEKLKRKIARARDRKLDKWKVDHNRDDMIRYVILSAVLAGDDLVPRNPDGTVAAGGDGRPVERERAVHIAMGMIAFGLPLGTPFRAVYPLVQRALNATAGTGGNEVAEELRQLAEASFVRSVGKKIEQEEKQHATSVRTMHRDVLR